MKILAVICITVWIKQYKFWFFSSLNMLRIFIFIATWFRIFRFPSSKFSVLSLQLLSSDDLWMFAPIAHYNGMDTDLHHKISTSLWTSFNFCLNIFTSLEYLFTCNAVRPLSSCFPMFTNLLHRVDFIKYENYRVQTSIMLGIKCTCTYWDKMNSFMHIIKKCTYRRTMHV